MTCAHLPLHALLSPTDIQYVLPASSATLSLSLSLSVSHLHSVGVSVPRMRWVTQAAALGIPGQLIIPHP